MNPILSIIVPSYKTEKYMNECLPKFVSDKLNGKIEVLLIDDGSPDHSLEKARSFEQKWGGIFRAIHKENAGHGSVINYGVRMARGKYFKVVDGDDFVETKSLEALVNYLEETDYDCVVTDYVIFSDNFSKIIKGKKTSSSNFDSYNFAIHSVTYKTNIFVSNNILLREKCFYEDNEYYLYPLPYLKDIGYLELPVYHYRLGQEGQSVSQESRWKHKDDLGLVFNDILKFKYNYTNKSKDIDSFVNTV